MDDLIKYLYCFVLENRMDHMLADREYRAGTQQILEQTHKVREHMTPEQRQDLDDLISAISSQNAMENECTFRAALELACELRMLV